MLDPQVAANRPALEMRWVPVTDEQGRTRLESVWIEAAATPTGHHHAA